MIEFITNNVGLSIALAIGGIVLVGCGIYILSSLRKGDLSFMRANVIEWIVEAEAKYQDWCITGAKDEKINEIVAKIMDFVPDSFEKYLTIDLVKAFIKTVYDSIEDTLEERLKAYREELEKMEEEENV